MTVGGIYYLEVAEPPQAGTALSENRKWELGVYLVHLNYQFENLERSISKVETVTIFR